jgi:hypothetical protein
MLGLIQTAAAQLMNWTIVNRLWQSEDHYTMDFRQSRTVGVSLTVQTQKTPCFFNITSLVVAYPVSGAELHAELFQIIIISIIIINNNNNTRYLTASYASAYIKNHL